MQSLHKPGRNSPHHTFFPRNGLRRTLPFIGLSLLGTVFANAPASAMHLASRVGFALPGAKPLVADKDNSALVGMFQDNTLVPATVALDGSETGEAQFQATLQTVNGLTHYTRSVHLTGQPQVIRFTIAARSGSFSVQLMQNGRSLASQQTVLIPSLRNSEFKFLALTTQTDLLQRLHNVGPLGHANTSDNTSYGHGGPGQQPMQQISGTPRLLAATPESLPDSAQAYATVDAVVVDDEYLLANLEPIQEEALRAYVQQGGKLILVRPPDKEPIRFEEFVTSLGANGWQSRRDGNNPEIKSKLYGTGSVSVVAFPPLQENYTYDQGSEPSYARMWHTLLNVNTLLYSPKEAFAASTQSNYSTDMVDALAGRQASQTVPFPLLTGFLLAYIVLIIPVNYLVLKRLDKRELAWLTVPALVFLFSGISYAAATALKGGKLTVNRAVIYEAFANTDTAAGYGQFTLYSPHHANYAISIGDAKNANNPYHTTVPLETDRFSHNTSNTDLTVAQNGFIEMQDVNIPQWDTRSFALPVQASLGGGIEARVTLSGSYLRYTLTNRTKYALHDCAVLLGDTSVPVGSLGVGETAQTLVKNSGTTLRNSYDFGQRFTQPVGYQSNGFGWNQTEESPEIARQRIQNALGMTIERDNFGYTGNNTVHGKSFCGLIGWFDGKTLDVQVDGKRTEGEQENMLYVHLPLPRSTKNFATEGSSLRDLIPNADANAPTDDTTQEVEDAD